MVVGGCLTLVLFVTYAYDCGFNAFPRDPQLHNFTTESHQTVNAGWVFFFKCAACCFERYILPKHKVYVGNMIDTIPQRWHEGRGVVQESGFGGDLRWELRVDSNIMGKGTPTRGIMLQALQGWIIEGQ